MHLELFPEVPAHWRNDALAEKWRKVRTVRRVVTGALEIERAAKRIGSSLEADPIVHVSDPELFEALVDVDLRGGLHHVGGNAGRRRRPGRRLPAAGGAPASRSWSISPKARKCARSWKISQAVGSDPDYPDVTPRDAQALREWDTMRKAARVAADADDGTSRRARTLWGPLTGSGLPPRRSPPSLDQASKLWLLFVFDLARADTVAVDAVPRSCADLEQGHQLRAGSSRTARSGNGRCSRSRPWRSRCCGSGWRGPASRLTAVSLGLIIGGAIGNAIDRLAYGAVADFVLLHLETATFSFNWYVFNLADAAIVAGVAGLLYEFLVGGPRRKSALIRGHNALVCGRGGYRRQVQRSSCRGVA